MCEQTICYLRIHLAKLAFIWSHVFVRLINRVQYSLSLFWSVPNPEGNIRFFSAAKRSTVFISKWLLGVEQVGEVFCLFLSFFNENRFQLETNWWKQQESNT